MFSVQLENKPNMTKYFLNNVKLHTVADPMRNPIGTITPHHLRPKLPESEVAILKQTIVQKKEALQQAQTKDMLEKKLRKKGYTNEQIALEVQKVMKSSQSEDGSEDEEEGMESEEDLILMKERKGRLNRVSKRIVMKRRLGVKPMLHDANYPSETVRKAIRFATTPHEETYE